MTADETWVREHVKPGLCGATSYSKGVLVWIRCEQLPDCLGGVGADDVQAWAAARKRLGG